MALNPGKIRNSMPPINRWSVSVGTTRWLTPNGRGSAPILSSKADKIGAEWEYAARGGLIGKKYPWGDSLSHDDANYNGTGGRDQWERTAPVGSFPPNGYGLYDMAGNVWEWCMDEYDSSFYAKSEKNNPVAGGVISLVNNNFTTGASPSRLN